LIKFETKPYTVTPYQMSQIAIREYIRTFWFAVAAVPLFGILVLLFGGPAFRLVGLVAIVWPFSIPARSLLVTNKSAKLFRLGVVLRLLDDAIEVCGEGVQKNGKRLRLELPLHDVRDAVDRGDFLLVRTMRFGYVPIVKSAFQAPEDQELLLSEISAMQIERVEALKAT